MRSASSMTSDSRAPSCRDYMALGKLFVSIECYDRCVPWPEEEPTLSMVFQSRHQASQRVMTWTGTLKVNARLQGKKHRSTHFCRWVVVPLATFKMITSPSQYLINPFKCVETCSESSFVGTSTKALVACLASSPAPRFYNHTTYNTSQTHLTGVRSRRKHTYSFSVQNLLYERYTVRRGLSASCTCACEDITVFEREGDGFLLDEGGTGEAKVCEGTEEKGGDYMGEGGERLRR